MKKVFEILKNKYFVLLLMMFTIFFISNTYIIIFLLKLNNIENLFRFLLILFLILLVSFFVIKIIKIITLNKLKLSIVYSIILLILFTSQSFIYNTFHKVYSSIDNISSNTTLYSSSLIVLKDSKIKNVKKLKDKKIGLYNNKKSIEGNIIPKEIIKENKLNSNNEIVEYDNMVDMIDELYSKNIDAIFLSTNYPIIFSYNGHKDIENETVILTSKEKSVKNKTKNEKEISKPFTILLMGVDSTLDNIKSGSAFNGDALMLVTFNPQTLSATMLSIPRDTYVPITCFKNQKENKITHAAWYGEECMINTIENFTKIDIDYYVKINFKGVVKLVDSLGGINVDVPYSFCEQNSNRQWGKETVFVEKGYRKLNGEQALALSRNRHKANDGSDIGKEMKNYCPKYTEGNRNDIERGQNQQKVIDGIISNLKNIKRIDDLYSLLDVMTNSFETNMNTNQILSLYDILKNMLLTKSNISITSLHLDGYDAMIWDDSFKTQLYNYYYYRQSLKDIVKEMNTNLEKEEPDIVKSITFSIKEQYQKPIIGSGPYNESRIKLLENFVKKDTTYLNNWIKNNNIKTKIEYVDVTDSKDNDIVLSQSIPYGTRLDSIKTEMLISVGKYTEKEVEVDLIPDFSKYSIEEANTWKDNNASITVVIETIETDDPLNSGKFVSQSITANEEIDKVEKITIVYYEKEKEL